MYIFVKQYNNILNVFCNVPKNQQIFYINVTANGVVINPKVIPNWQKKNYFNPQYTRAHTKLENHNKNSILIIIISLQINEFFSNRHFNCAPIFRFKKDKFPKKKIKLHLHLYTICIRSNKEPKITHNANKVHY